jgi:hypothetical protein
VLHAKRVEDSCCTRPTPCPAPVRLYFFDLSRVRVQQSGSVFFVSGPAPVPSFRALVFSASISYCRRLRVQSQPRQSIFPLRIQGLGFARDCFTHESAPDCAAPQPFKFLRTVWCYVRFCLQSSILSVIESLQEEVGVILELPDRRAREFSVLFVVS